MTKAKYLIFLLVFFTVSCNSKFAALFPDLQRKTTNEQETQIEEVELSPVEITDYSPDSEEPLELDPYNPASDQSFDLIHTMLDLSFNWQKESVIGTAQLTLKPRFYTSSTLSLDAVNFKVNSVKDLNTGFMLSYDYIDRSDLVISLDKEYTRDDTLRIEIDYIAFPSKTGGSAAISSDRGLFFINPTGIGDKPQQIWTQGETEHNSKWFPTIDKPNARTSQEVKLTVEDKFVTLSNGLLIDSKDNGNGMRTDHWLQEKSHAPYLFAVVVGSFSKVQDKWRDIDVDYYVEPMFEDYARDIFPYTVEMLEFFSTTLGVDYPWDKYAQIVVRDYVSGAMENTSAVIFGEFMNGTDRDLIDVDVNEKIVAHEMMHHWFGDLVTCESWSNLTLNEGFANYSEYMWTEHKHGKELADFHKLNEKESYLSSLTYNMHPLIHYGYNDKEDMFDAHSYNKGGLVLHMLRYLVGDEAFFASCKRYLEDNAYTEVEIDELRLAFEDVTGKDLNWFFDQWFLSSGQPTLNISKSFDSANNELTVKLRQTHSNEEMPSIFQLPVDFEVVYNDGSKEVFKRFLNKREDLFVFNVKAKPALIIFDPENTLLAIKHFDKKDEEYLFQLKHASSFEHRFIAFQKLIKSGPYKAEAINLALNDRVWVTRKLALEQLDTAALLSSVYEMAKNDPHSEVRSAALSTLIRMNDRNGVDLAEHIIKNDKSYNVISAAIDYLSFTNSPRSAEIAASLENSDSDRLLLSVGNIYLKNETTDKLSFFMEAMDRFSSYELVDFLQVYTNLIILGNSDQIEEGAGVLLKISLDDNSDFLSKIASTYALNNLYFNLFGLGKIDNPDLSQKEAASMGAELKLKMLEIKEKEKDPVLQDYYSQFPVFN
jgi:aminopeptidase N